MFPRILTLIVALLVGGAQAQIKGDDQVVDAYQAWRQGNRAKLAQLLPQVQGDSFADVSLSANLAATGPAAGAALPLAGVLTDFTGQLRPTNGGWTIGAVQG